MIDWGSILQAAVAALILGLLLQLPIWYAKRRVKATDDADAAKVAAMKEAEAKLHVQDKELAVLRARVEAVDEVHDRGTTDVNNALRDIAASFAGLRHEVHGQSERIGKVEAVLSRLEGRMEQVAERAHKAANLAAANQGRIAALERRPYGNGEDG